MNKYNYIIRYSAEIVIKSDKVRNRFQKCLIENIKKQLNILSIEYEIKDFWSYVILHASKDLEYVLSNIFGISYFAKIDMQIKSSFEDILKNSCILYKDKLFGKTFAVKCNRRFKSFKYNSDKINKEIGNILFKYSNGVNLTNPEFKIYLDIYKDFTFFYRFKKQGAKGLPISTEGRALALVSGGFDSLVASWMMMKRGLKLDFLFYNLANERYKIQVIEVIKYFAKRWCFYTDFKFYNLEFQSTLSKIKEKIKPSYNQLVLKYFFIKIAYNFCKKQNYPAIITGDSLGQVASQTLQNIVSLDKSFNITILRPLIGLDKEEIINLSKKIGSYDLSANIKEYCQISNSKPVTNSCFDRLKKEIIKIDDNSFDSLIENINNIDLNFGKLNKNIILDKVYLDFKIIDCRSENDFKKDNIPNSVNMNPKLILNSICKFDKDKNYILYCDTGIESAEIADYMTNLGYNFYSLKGGYLKYKKKISY